MECKKQGAKNRVIIIQKEKRQPGHFWLTFFITLLYGHPIGYSDT